MDPIVVSSCASGNLWLALTFTLEMLFLFLAWCLKCQVSGVPGGVWRVLFRCLECLAGVLGCPHPHHIQDITITTHIISSSSHHHIMVIIITDSAGVGGDVVHDLPYDHLAAPHYAITGVWCMILQVWCCCVWYGRAGGTGGCSTHTAHCPLLSASPWSGS